MPNLQVHPMSLRYVTIAKVADSVTHTGDDWRVHLVADDGHRFSFVTSSIPPPPGTTFEVRIIECGDFYGTG